MTERKELNLVGQCFQRHRALIDAAMLLHRRLATVHPDADLLRLGANCMRIAAHSALQSREVRQTLRDWKECALAERQIRLATYRALRDGAIDAKRYDEVFALARVAARTREDERQRLRRQLLRMDVV
jgi:hypothetical protein